MNHKTALLAAVCLLSLSWTTQGALLQFDATLSGPNEAPPNASPGTGSAVVHYDTVAHTLRVEAIFADLIGVTTAAHIHAPTAVAGLGTAGVATTTPTFPGFPLGVTSGTYDQTFDLTLASSFNASFVTASGGTVGQAEARLANALMDGKAYFNIHTASFPGGEIRGFLIQNVPDNFSTAGLFALAILGMIALSRKQCVQRVQQD